MRKWEIVVAGALTLAACSAAPEQLETLCDREAVEWDKWGTPDLPDGCAEPKVLGIVITNDIDADKGDTSDNLGNKPNDTGSKPDAPGDDPNDPGEHPDGPVGEPDAPVDSAGKRQDNGLGNGDQTAPGNSFNRNRAENEVGNPGHASGKPQKAN